MTTYTIPGFSVVFDAGDQAIAFTPNTGFIIVAPDASTSFTYTYDFPADPLNNEITISNGDYSAVVGGSNLPLSSAIATEAISLQWGAGNTTDILLFIFDIGGVDTEFVMVLGGDALPVMNTLADFIAFDLTITGDGKITSGTNAPGMTIPYYNLDTTENDIIVGTAINETFDGGAGNDSIDGAGGDDSLLGGIGNDTLIGGAGFDRLSGGDGDDTLNPGENVGSTDLIFDTILGSLGTDTIIYSDNIVGFQELNYHGLNQGITVSLNGSTNTATVQKESTTDTIVDVINPLNAGWTTGGLGIYGSAENDVFNITLAAEQWMQVRGFEGDNTFNLTLNAGVVRVDYVLNPTFGIMVDLTMGVGNVSDNGLGGVDTINVTGTGGQLELRATSFADTIVGSSGDERFILMGGSDSLDGGLGNDLLRYDRGGVVDGVTVDLGAGTATGTWSGVGFTHTISGIESVRGSNTGGDTLSGDGLANTLDGRGGNDTLTGGLGNDMLDGGLGNDTASFAGALNDVNVYLQYTGRQTGDGVDTLIGIENLIGSSFNDRLIGDAGDNIFTGGAGNDIIKGKGGTDQFYGGDGNDTMRGDVGDDMLFGGAGIDILFGLNGLDQLFGGIDGDFLYGGRDNDIVNGDAGNDVVRGNLGFDSLFGGAGVDDLRGGGGGDFILDGGADNDFLFGEGGADTLHGGAGDDALSGGFGGGVGDTQADVFIFADAASGSGGFDRIKDFENGLDTFDLTAFGFTDFTTEVATLATDVTGGLRINFGGGDVLFVENFLKVDFDATDVLL